MKKIAVVALMIVALMAMSGVASAEHGNIGGIGMTNTTIRPMESGNIGGVGVK